MIKVYISQNEYRKKQKDEGMEKKNSLSTDEVLINYTLTFYVPA